MHSADPVLERMDGAKIASLRAAARAPRRNGVTVMYGLIGKIRVALGQRDALIDILLEGTADMPGCQSYVVAHDPTDPDAVWITEVWDSQDSHAASLSLPSVQQALARGMPLIAGFDQRFVTAPVGGHGLPLAQ